MSKLLGKPFETWHGFYTSHPDLNDLIIPFSHVAKRRRKTKTAISSDKDESTDIFTHKPSIQKRAGSVKETWNINNINYAIVREWVENIPEVDNVVLPPVALSSNFPVMSKRTITYRNPILKVGHQRYLKSFHHHSVTSSNFSLEKCLKLQLPE